MITERNTTQRQQTHTQGNISTKNGQTQPAKPK